MGSIDSLTEQEQAEFDRLTQAEGDDVYLTPTQTSQLGITPQQHRPQPQRQQRQAPTLSAPRGSPDDLACCTDSQQAGRRGHWRGRRCNDQHYCGSGDGDPYFAQGHPRGPGMPRGEDRGGAGYTSGTHAEGGMTDGHFGRDGLGSLTGARGGGLSRGGGGGDAAAAMAAFAEARRSLGVSIKDVLQERLRTHLEIDNSERFRRTPGSFRVHVVSAEARSAAADAALAAARGEAPAPPAPPPLLPIVFVRGDSCGGNGSETSNAGLAPGASGASGAFRGESGGSGVGRDGDRDAGVGDAAWEGEREGAGDRALQRPDGLRKMKPKAARPAVFEKHTREYGSRFLERSGFDGTTGARENDYVTTFADKAVAGALKRGGNTGGLGYRRAEAVAAKVIHASVRTSAVSAPCDMDASRQLGDPPKSYYGVTVEFPFETPMVPQDQMMQRIIAALKSKRHALLESPTGTGKSAAFLCAALAWQRDELVREGKAPQIFYGARTHTQLEQMVKVLKSLPYCPTMAILGSRTRLCINPMVVGDGPATAEEAQDNDDDGDGDDENNENDGRGRYDGAGGGSGGARGWGGRPPLGERPTSNSIQESCQALRSKADSQRKNCTHLKLPGGGKVPYDQDAPDLTLDLANIDGSLTDSEKQHAACPFYRSMSAPTVALAAHEFARPKVGLVDGHDGCHAIEDLRAFCANPMKGFSGKNNEKDKAKLEERQSQRAGCGCDGGQAHGSVGGRCGNNNNNNNNDNSSNNNSSSNGGGRSSATVSSGGGAPFPAYIDLSYDASDGDDAVPVGTRTAVAGVGGAGAVAAAGARMASPVSSAAAAGAASETKEDEEPQPQLLACPYYMSQALAKQAQLVLVPYNYLLDPSIRSAITLSLDGAVVILDEAHNVEGVCRDAGSLELPLLDMVAMASDLCDVSHVPGASVLLTFVMQLARFTARESHTLDAFHQEAAFQWRRRNTRQDNIEKCWACDSAGSMFWTDFAQGGDASLSHASLTRAMGDLKVGMQEIFEAAVTPALHNLEKVLFVTGLALHHPHDYNVNIVSWDNVEQRKFPAHNRTSTSSPHASCPLRASPFSRTGYVPRKLCGLNMWLQTPSVVLEQVSVQSHSLVLTSGTLSPLHSIRAELGRSFGERLLPFPQLALEANHVIKPGRQLLVIPVGKSPGGEVLRCVNVNVGRDPFVNEIGRTVVALAEHIPRGVLVFLPSYNLLRRAAAIWRASGVWASLERCKGVIVEEPQAAAEFKAAKRLYEAAIDAPGGNGSAILLAVYRGKMSEGISFNDQYARGVLCVGIPFPNFGCHKVQAKMLYNKWKTGRRPSEKERGGAGPRSWPAICAEGDHGYDGACIGGGERKGGGGGDKAAAVEPAGGVGIEPPGIFKEEEEAVAAATEKEAAASAKAAAVAAADTATAAVAAAAGEAAEKAGSALLTGQDWYLQEAYRALNQALGRCIRHIYDYGVICLIDDRFRVGDTKHVKFLARWMRDLLGDFSDLGEVADTMDQFFASAPGFVQEEKDKAARSRQQAACRRRARAQNRAVFAAAGVAVEDTSAGGGLVPAEAGSNPVGIKMEPDTNSMGEGGAEIVRAGSGGGDGGGAGRMSDGEDVQGPNRCNKRPGVVTPPPRLIVDRPTPVTPTTGLSSFSPAVVVPSSTSSRSSSLATNNTPRDCPGDVGGGSCSLEEDSDGDASGQRRAAPVGVFGSRDCDGGGGGMGGSDGDNKEEVREEDGDLDAIDLTAMGVVLTQERDEEASFRLMYDV